MEYAYCMYVRDFVPDLNGADLVSTRSCRLPAQMGPFVTDAWLSWQLCAAALQLCCWMQMHDMTWDLYPQFNCLADNKGSYHRGSEKWQMSKAGWTRMTPFRHQRSWNKLYSLAVGSTWREGRWCFRSHQRRTDGGQLWAVSLWRLALCLPTYVTYYLLSDYYACDLDWVEWCFCNHIGLPM